MKRFLTFLIVIAMLLSLTSCVTIVRRGDESSEWEEAPQGNMLTLTLRPTEGGVHPTASQLEAFKTVVEQRLKDKGYTNTHSICVDAVNGTLQVDVLEPMDQKAAEQLGKELVARPDLLQFRKGADTDANGAPVGELVLDSNDIESAKAMYQSLDGSDAAVQSVVALTMKESGKLAFAAATRQQAAVHGTISMWLGNYLFFNPTVNDAITDGEAIITGFNSYDEAKQLADLITAGMIPFDWTAEVEFTHTDK